MAIDEQGVRLIVNHLAPAGATAAQIESASRNAMLLKAARDLGATPSGFGLWSVPGYPELTAGQLIDIRFGGGG